MIKTENDLWQAFGGNDPNKPGASEIVFAKLFEQCCMLDISTKGKKGPLRLRFKTTDRTRYYRLRCNDVIAVVDQARLFTMGRKISAPDLIVEYLGTHSP